MGLRNLFFLSLLTFIFACNPAEEEDLFVFDDYRYELSNEKFTVRVDSNRTIRAYLTKPEGSQMDLVIILHGGTIDPPSSFNATLRYATKQDGGRIFLEQGMAVLSVDYTEFESNGSISPRGFKELEDVVATIDWLKTDPFEKNQFKINRIFTFGHSRGGGLALLAGIERQIDGAISAAGPLDWIATYEAILDGTLNPNVNEIGNFQHSVALWGLPGSTPDYWTKFSPGLRVDEFKSPFLIISGRDDEVILPRTVYNMRTAYNKCHGCVDESYFVVHPFGHSNWANAATVESILRFIE